MNYRAILKVYSAERRLTDDETAFLNTLRAMNDSERELLVESLSPEKPVSRARKKPAGKKSARAASLSEKIQGTAGPKSIDGGVSKMRCVQEGCGEYADNPIHDSLMGYRGYHEFDSGQQAATVSGD